MARLAFFKWSFSGTHCCSIFFIYLFILQMFFHSFKLAPFSLLTSKKYDKFLRVSLHIFHQAQTLKMLGVLFYNIFWMSFYVNKIPNPFYKF